MSALRLFCLLGAAVTAYGVANSVRKMKIKIEDSIFWILLTAFLLLVAIFPQVAYFLSDLLGFQSMSNFLFVVTIGILLLKEFSNTMQISQLRHKVNELSQEAALSRKELEDER
jgi:hypothetical protein